MLNNIKWYDWLMVAGIAVIVLINPFIGQYIIQAIILGYEQLIILSDMAITLGLTLVAVGFVASKVASREKSRKKYSKLKNSKRESAGAYIATK